MGAQWSQSTNLKVFVTEAQYEASQHVSGEVFVNVVSPIQFSKLTIDISGAQSASYTAATSQSAFEADPSTFSFVQVDQSEPVIKASATLLSGQTLNPGRYRLPFIFVLPASVPGTSKLRGQNPPFSAEIRYTIAAQFEDGFLVLPNPAADPAAAAATGADGASEPEVLLQPVNIMDFLEFVVVEANHNVEAPKPMEVAVVRKGLLPCSKPKVVTLRFKAGTSVVTEGDTIVFNVDLENPLKQKLHDVTVSIWQIVTFTVPKHLPHIVRTKIFSKEIESHSHNINVETKVPEGTQQSLRASLFEVSYEAMLEGFLGPERILLSQSLCVLLKPKSQAVHLQGFRAPKGWEKIDPTGDVIRIQIDGAPAPDIGNFEAIGYVLPPV